MKRKIANIAIIIAFTAIMLFMGYVDSLKTEISGGKLLLDVPEDFVTDVYTVKSVRQEEIDSNKVSFNKSEILADIDEMVAELPSGAKDMLEPYTILVTERNMVDVYHIINPSQMFSSFNMFKAVVVYEKQVVCLDANNLAYRDSLYHELAHVIDYSLDWVSDSEEFQDIYKREKEQFVLNISMYPYTRTNHGVDYCEAEWFTVIDTPVEYFAESFNNYYLHREILEEYCPETYAYIDALVKELER